MTFSFYQQRGTTLMVSLTMLLLLTLLAVTGMQTTIFEEKMTNNMRDHDTAFQAAESALLEGEAFVTNLVTEPIPTVSCASHPCVISYDPVRYLEDQTSTWWTANSAGFASATLLNVKTQPRYIVEFFKFVSDSPEIGNSVPLGTNYYRITTRGTGITDESTTILQTTVAKRF